MTPGGSRDVDKLRHKRRRALARGYERREEQVDVAMAMMLALTQNLNPGVRYIERNKNSTRCQKVLPTLLLRKQSMASPWVAN